MWKPKVNRKLVVIWEFILHFSISECFYSCIIWQNKGEPDVGGQHCPCLVFIRIFRKILSVVCPDFRCPCPPTSGWNCYILYVTYILLGKHPIFTVGEKNLTKKPTILQGRMGLSGSNEYKNVILYIFALVKYANQLIILASTCPIHLSQWSKIHKII